MQNQYQQQMSQGGQPMPGMNPNYGQPVGQAQYPQTMGGQYNPMQQNPQGLAPGMQQGASQGGYENKPKSTVVEVIRSNYTTIALFEVSGGYDPAQQFPKALCFVMGVPGVKDPSKQSGRSYVQAQKIVMKFSTQEVRSLGQALINIATFKQAAANFVKHSDPSKNTYSQAGANQAQAKKLEAKFDQNRSNIVITMNYGSNNVMVPVPLQDAYGLGHDLINIGNFADNKLADYKIANRIGKEEITGIDYDPAGAEDHTQQGQPQYNPQQGYSAPQAQPQYQQVPGYGAPQGQPQPQPQYNPAMYQGMPGAQ